MKLTLIRHTHLAIAPGVCYGQSDIDVANSFNEELAIIQSKLVDNSYDAIYSSSLQRCAKLAQALNRGEAKLDERLKELNFGDWELQAWEDIPRDVFDDWAHDYAHLSPPNGETFSQLQQRGIHFLTQMLMRYPNGHIAVVTHGGMIRALLAHALDLPLKGLFRFVINYGSITQLEFGGVESVPKINFVNL